MKKYFNLILIAMSCLVSFTSSAVSVQPMGNTVIAQTDISMNVETITQVSPLQDIIFNSVNSNSSALLEACIYTNAPSGQYRVMWHSAHGGSGSEFYMQHQFNKDYLGYTIKDNQGTLLQQDLPSGTYNVTTSTVDCTGAGDKKSQFYLTLTSNPKHNHSLAAGEYISDLTIQVDSV